jgi:hypothetical protein
MIQFEIVAANLGGVGAVAAAVADAAVAVVVAAAR